MGSPSLIWVRGSNRSGDMMAGRMDSGDDRGCSVFPGRPPGKAATVPMREPAASINRASACTVEPRQAAIASVGDRGAQAASPSSRRVW